MKKYTISVNLNRIRTPYKDDFKKARLYHLKHGIDIKFIFRKVDVTGYRSVTFTQPNGFKQYILSGADKLIKIDSEVDANMFVFDMGEWATDDGSPFPLLPETPNGSCMLIGDKPFINVGTYKVDHDSGQTWIQIAHEIMHSYVQNGYLDGVNIPDVMDTYRENGNPDSPTGNFAEQWTLLKNYLK
jgi:hypothetical protein